MNYLAHLFLAKNTQESRLGNLLGDFVKGNLESKSLHYSQEIITGIRTHRQVDYFTDNHPIHLQSKQRIISSQGRFSGILIDIFYDHFLAYHWHLFSSDRLENFANNIYLMLNNNCHLLPKKLQIALPSMIAENWLVSYRTLEGIKITCERLGKRIKRDNHLAVAHQTLQTHYHELESDFFVFFPQLIEYVAQNRQTFERTKR